MYVHMSNLAFVPDSTHARVHSLLPRVYARATTRREFVDSGTGGGPSRDRRRSRMVLSRPPCNLFSGWRGVDKYQPVAA